jgi:flagella basal body P-ring formation protein FlgA
MSGIVVSDPPNISAKKPGNARQFAALDWPARSYSGSVDQSLRPSLSRIGLWLACVLVLAFARAHAEPPAPTAPALGLAEQVQRLAQDAGARSAGAGARVEVEVGQLDPRLRLAPCERIDPYLPAGSRPWGRTRVGLRCLQGPTHWNVFLPVTVKVYARALVATAALPAGAVLGLKDLREAEVDLAAGSSAAVTEPGLALGRSLVRPLAAGDALRQADLKARQYFAAGQTVQLVALGDGYQVSGEGQALTPGIEGQPTRVRTDSGRIVTGQPVAEHRVEIPL